MNDDELWIPDGPSCVVFSLGPRYSSEDMYRDMGIERPKLDVPWSDTVHDVTITIGDSEKP